MDLSDILANVADQDRGRELQVANPWTGEPTGITFRIAGPDSEVQHRARIEMMDELAEMARPDGTISGADRESARLNCLAKCVLAMSIEEDGRPVLTRTPSRFRPPTVVRSSIPPAHRVAPTR